ncbi:hypothetical protein [Neoaquamicrobium microcysteis]|uniref:hypothetical protein n=1 Tax=Neoaquamicrobium microcysteis TaxID=2682781 RepID=UPI001375FD4F|nr:hypothetical protein [Mesorhizobium microcysteis]
MTKPDRGMGAPPGLNAAMAQIDEPIVSCSSHCRCVTLHHMAACSALFSHSAPVPLTKALPSNSDQAHLCLAFFGW